MDGRAYNEVEHLLERAHVQVGRSGRRAGLLLPRRRGGGGHDCERAVGRSFLLLVGVGCSCLVGGDACGRTVSQSSKEGAPTMVVCRQRRNANPKETPQPARDQSFSSKTSLSARSTRVFREAGCWSRYAGGRVLGAR